MISNYPMVSIIVLSYNGSKLGKIFDDCIGSVLKTDYPRYEIILVDNGSSDDSAEVIAHKYKGINLLKLSKNLGFTGGNNEGAKAASASSSMIVFLNSDVLLKENWLKPMVDVLLKDSEVAVVGAEGVVKSYGGKTFFLPRFQRPFFAPVAQGYCMLIRKELFDFIGGFNTNLFMYEDEVDFCDRIHSVGRTVAILSSQAISHLGSGSINANNMSTAQVYLLSRNTFYTVFNSAESTRLPLALIFLLLHSFKRCFNFKDFNRMRAAGKGMVDGFFGMKRGTHPKTGRRPTKLDLPPISLDLVNLFLILRRSARKIANAILLQRVRFLQSL